MAVLNSWHYAYDFNKFITLNPTNGDLAEWNRRRMNIALQLGDAENAGFYATELVRWSLLTPRGGYRKDRPKRTPKVVFDRLRVVC